jgi:hypothetical protein
MGVDLQDLRPRPGGPEALGVGPGEATTDAQLGGDTVPLEERAGTAVGGGAAGPIGAAPGRPVGPRPAA